jgi:GAF domain-containing protein/anti-sigma regulatory factor (Ser/Thr protein kinase)
MPSETSVVSGDPCIEELGCELAEAREQQAATARILAAISSSSPDPSRVLAEIAASAARLCDAYDATIHQVEGDQLQLIAHHGPIRTAPKMPLVDAALLGRALLERQEVQIADLSAECTEYPEGSSSARRPGARTTLAVPLIHIGNPIGVIVVRRAEIRPYTDRQVGLLKIFADQAIIAIENARLFRELQVRTKDLQECLEYQTATSEVLGVISRSPIQLQPVLRSIAQTAARLCDSFDAQVYRLVDGGGLQMVAQHGSLPRLPARYQLPLTRGSVTGRAIVDRQTVHVDDISALLESEFPDAKPSQVVVGHRTTLATPLMREGQPIGAILLRRTEVRPFSPKQVSLLQTFADQAVIAIENTRLFEAEQASKRELQESLQYQTASAEVLSVISRSPNQLQPVLDAITQTATRLCHADYAHFRLLRDGAYHVASSNNYDPITLKRLTPIAPGPGSITGRVALECKTIHLPDILTDATGNYSRQYGEVARTGLGVPLVKGQTTVGVIMLFRSTVRPFTERQIALVNTFAEQALIAMENTRLFEEVQARNTELNIALEQQTATSELLKVIGRSAFDLKPVFETLIESAVKLCGATRGFVSRFDGKRLRFEAGYNVTPELTQYFEQNPFALDRHSNTGRAAIERRAVHNIDVQADPEYTYGGKQVDPYRTVLAIPMLKADELLGVILLYRHEVLPFSNSQITLMETFADQAAIAIENARLFQEVEARNRDLTALGEVGRAVSSSLELKVVLPRILEHACTLSDTGGGAIYVFDRARNQFDLEAGLNMSEELIAQVRGHPIQIGESLVGQCAERREAVQYEDLSQAPPHPLIEMHMKESVRALLAVPLLHQDEVVGALVVRRMRPGAFAAQTIALLQSFASQSAIAIQNARLFDEIAQKSRELEIASQHKSQFVANMSHELRTPLAAILGYAELMQEGFYEPQGAKSLAALTRIRSNGKHLLGLINTVLDIAKIESGQFSLNLGEYALENVVETVRAATEALAESKKLRLKTEVAERLPIGVGDEQRLTQVLLNLVGNAIKFTDAGEVCIAAAVSNGHFGLTVTDTGPGIPEEHQPRIFEQFHQVDSSNTKAKGGTGLGLAIAKQIVEMHGGRIWVESMFGKGATFQVELPIHAESRKAMA